MITHEEQSKNISVITISEIGANHRIMLQPNQDSVSYRISGEDFVLAVSDGVGSCCNADVGSSAAVNTCVDAFTFFGNNPRAIDDTVLAQFIVDTWKNKLENLSIDDCCTTLKAVIKFGSTLKLISIGDGFIAVSSDGIRMLSPEESTAFCNETNCLCSKTRGEEIWIANFRLDTYKPYAVVCCTDGIANGLVAGTELSLVEEIEKNIAAKCLRSELEDLVVDISNYCFDDKTIGVVKYERKN